MAGWGLYVGFVGGAALVVIALIAARKAAVAIDDTFAFGDGPALPEEFGGRRSSRAGGGIGPATERTHTTHHGLHPHDRGAS